MKAKIVGLSMGLVLTAGLLAGCGSFGGMTSAASMDKPAEQAVEQAATEEIVTAAVEEAVVEEAVEEAVIAEAAAEEAVEEAAAQAAALEATAITAEAVTAEETSDLPEGQMYSYLTGEPISTEIGSKRPFAVMINNLDAAVPQSAIVNADMLYECYVEGNITRLMAVFQDPTPYDKIGPVRSARHYYMDYAFDNSAIYTHFGWSFVAEDRIKTQGWTTINGQFYDGVTGFYRTEDRVAPHNAYTTGQGLVDIANELGIDRSYPEGFKSNLAFNRTDTPLEGGEDALYVSVPYAIDNPWFEYNPADGLYYRFEYGAPHVDMETGEQLKFKNVIVQIVDQSLYLEDPILLELYLVGKGTGYYFTDGKVIPIVWEKESTNDRTMYYTTDGQQLKMNPGKTMFEVAPPEMNITWSADQSGAELADAAAAAAAVEEAQAVDAEVAGEQG